MLSRYLPTCNAYYVLFDCRVCFMKYCSYIHITTCLCSYIHILHVEEHRCSRVNCKNLNSWSDVQPPSTQVMIKSPHQALQIHSQIYRTYTYRNRQVQLNSLKIGSAVYFFFFMEIYFLPRIILSTKHRMNGSLSIKSLYRYLY